MKAQEYYNKHKNTTTSTRILQQAQEYYNKHFACKPQDCNAEANAMFIEMLDEYKVLLDKRNPKTVGGVAGIVRELNDKWNSIATKVEAAYGTKVLKRNVIWNVLLAERFSEAFERKPD